MLTAPHFEAIGRLVYRSTLMESRICYLLLILRNEGLDGWAAELKKFRFSKALEELKTFVPRAYPSRLEQVLASLKEADDLNSKRNDIVHGLWRLPAEDLFGPAAHDIVGVGSAARAFRVPATKDAGPYSVSYTAEQIEAVAQKMQSVTVELVKLSLYRETAR
ncbi:MAG: hypothetical protein WAO71_07605 [Gallionella sp.]